MLFELRLRESHKKASLLQELYGDVNTVGDPGLLLLLEKVTEYRVLYFFIFCFVKLNEHLQVF